jgi:hypothetical protein
MKSQDYLTSDHPSFKCKNAWFMFACKNPNGPGFSKLLLVEAENECAVAAIERLVAVDGYVNPSCELLSVHRQCVSIGIRSDMADQLSYIEFMSDVVEYSRYKNDKLAMEAFQNSLSPKDRELAIDRLTRKPTSRLVQTMKPRSSSMQEAEAILIDLGYKSNQVRRMIQELDADTMALPLEALIKAILQKQAA